MNDINKFLNNYFEGIASLDEERALKYYFSGNAVLPEHEVYKPLFATLADEKRIKAPQVHLPKQKNNRKITIRHLLTATMSAAAALLLVLILFPKNTSSAKSEYVVFINGQQITNPQTAQQYAEKMFAQADEIIRASYQPFIEVKSMQKEMDANIIFDNAYQQINHIKSTNK